MVDSFPLSGPPLSPSFPSPSLFLLLSEIPLSLSLHSLPPLALNSLLPSLRTLSSFFYSSFFFFSLFSFVSSYLYLHSFLLPIVPIIPACLMVCLFFIYLSYYPSCISSFLSMVLHSCLALCCIIRPCSIYNSFPDTLSLLNPSI